MNGSKVIGYVRVSTEEQVTDGFSLDNQRHDITQFCKFRGWNLIEIFDDEGISGAGMDDRVGLRRALRFMKQNEIEYLVVWKLSRLSRRVSDVVKIVEQLEFCSAHLISIKDNIDTSSPMGKPFLYIASIFAEMERDNLIVQVKGGMAQKAREGRWNGGVTPIGYKVIDKKLEIVPEEAEIVKTIFDLYLKGNGYLAIANELNRKGVKTRKNFAFSGISVKSILTNPVYNGKVRWGKLKNWDKKDANGKRKRTYNEDLKIYEGIHEALISDSAFDLVQTMVKNNPRCHVRQFNGFHLLSGLLRCPHCGYGMSIQNARLQNKTYSYYICNQYQNKKTCSAACISKESIEEEFYMLLDFILRNKSYQDLICKSLENPEEDILELRNNLKRKNTELKKNEDKSSKLLDELLEGDDYYKDQLRQKIHEVNQLINSIKSDIIRLNIEIEELLSLRIEPSVVMKQLEYVGQLIKLMEPAAQQSLVRKLVNYIEVEGGHIKVIYFVFNEAYKVELNDSANYESTFGYQDDVKSDVEMAMHFKQMKLTHVAQVKNSKPILISKERSNK